MDTLWKTFHICDLISPITELVWLFPIVIQSLSHDRLCNPMDCSMPGFPVLHGFLEFAQTHVIELVMPSNHHFLCHPLLLLLSIFPSIRVFSNELASGSQRTGASASVFSIIFQGQFPLIGLLSLLSKGLSRVLSSTTVWQHQFFSAQPSLWSSLTSIHDYQKNHTLTVQMYNGNMIMPTPKCPIIQTG